MHNLLLTYEAIYLNLLRFVIPIFMCVTKANASVYPFNDHAFNKTSPFLHIDV